MVTDVLTNCVTSGLDPFFPFFPIVSVSMSQTETRPYLELLKNRSQSLGSSLKRVKTFQGLCYPMCRSG